MVKTSTLFEMPWRLLYISMEDFPRNVAGKILKRVMRDNYRQGID
jgi:hypothetical protein